MHANFSVVLFYVSNCVLMVQCYTNNNRNYMKNHTNKIITHSDEKQKIFVLRYSNTCSSHHAKNIGSGIAAGLQFYMSCITNYINIETSNKTFDLMQLDMIYLDYNVYSLVQCEHTHQNQLLIQKHSCKLMPNSKKQPNQFIADSNE